MMEFAFNRFMLMTPIKIKINFLFKEEMKIQKLFYVGIGGLIGSWKI